MEDYLYISNNTAGAYVQLENKGAFFARILLSYLLEGREYTTSTGAFAYGLKKSLNIPSTATAITINIQIEVAVESWYTVLTKISATPGQYCYQVSGTTLAPYCQQVPCSSDNNGGNVSQPMCCCCCCCCCPSSMQSNCYPYSDSCYNYSSDYYSMDSCTGMDYCVTNPCTGVTSCTDMNSCVTNPCTGVTSCTGGNYCVTDPCTGVTTCTDFH
ncbi:hypothetical protein [Clostridium botulinum]|uniref:hypothetical protein n=1 Tax=Clostridium botulinum TaxID=1491 RepID=UPI001E4EEE74|nr:hypothetical protein [Clostridium botulinum]MCD3239336.1 hypothetical protein [Clostridium botulinum D/C]MCD3298875.1 hypothetical protein [Clostridium botulinum D/C]MCD3305244.1 hypothetical protein [Clostridium botulinum D/C]MCD3316783.1 hypothetical protein [Clostridium botulinum D/C]MCD3319330.1 hypothetical protein [Clostridium botulinum D/C]